MSTDLGAGSAPSRLDILLTNKTAAPLVRVTDADGRRVTSYQVMLLPRDPGRWQGVVLGSPAEPPRDGVLSLGPRLPGDYLVAAIPFSDYRVILSDSTRIAALASVATPVTFVEGDDRTFELRLTRLPAARQ